MLTVAFFSFPPAALTSYRDNCNIPFHDLDPKPLWYASCQLVAFTKDSYNMIPHLPPSYFPVLEMPRARYGTRPYFYFFLRSRNFLHHDLLHTAAPRYRDDQNPKNPPDIASARDNMSGLVETARYPDCRDPGQRCDCINLRATSSFDT